MEKSVYYVEQPNMATSRDIPDFYTANVLAKAWNAFNERETIIFEQIGRNPPEPIAIWQKSA